MRSKIKIGSKNNLYPQSYFIEHLVDAFEKPPQKSNSFDEPSSLLIQWLNNYIRNHLQIKSPTKIQSLTSNTSKLHASKDGRSGLAHARAERRPGAMCSTERSPLEEVHWPEISNKNRRLTQANECETGCSTRKNWIQRLRADTERTQSHEETSKS
jgi:hypothetical protein